MRKENPLRTLLVLTLLVPAGAAAAGAGENAVFEPFVWSGAHAATIAAQPPATGPFATMTHDCAPLRGADATSAETGGYATTVWWNADLWDARGDTSYPAITNPPATGYHVDVHNAVSADPTDGREDNTVYAVGGDGSPGVAAMRMDFQGIAGARLRNPMLVSATRPGVVSFYTTAFQTTAHWWEIVLTPTDTVTGAEHTAVPSPDDGLDGPFAASAGTPGPGRRPAVDSINLIGTGSSDVPCSTGWSTRFAVTRSLGGVTTDVFNPITSFDELVQTDPSEVEELYLWRVEVWPDRIDLAADLDRDGTPEPLESFAVTVPWSEVYVHFVSVTYQADHHPMEPCYLGPVREFLWRNLSVEPVKYARTLVYPKETGTTNLPRDTGWTSYDLRDIQRHGPPVGGVPQANPEAFDQWESLLACSMPAFYCPHPSTVLDRDVEIPGASLAGLARAQLVYDVRSPLAPGTATLLVNGTVVGAMPGHATVPGAPGSEWVRRSLDFDPSLLHPGVNEVRVVMSGDVELDRLQIELALGDPAPLFTDGFETGDATRWSAAVP